MIYVVSIALFIVCFFLLLSYMEWIDYIMYGDEDDDYDERHDN